MLEKEELLMLTHGEYKPEDYPKTVHAQKGLILHIDRDPVNPEDGHCAYLVLEEAVWMTTHRGEQMDMHNGVELCPDNARVFVAGLGLGLILLYLARAKKTREVLVGEINPLVIEVVEPRLRSWFLEHYPDFNWSVVLGDAKVEAQKHGEFDWFFWDIWPVADFKKRASDEFVEISKPHLTERGVITTWHDLAKMRRDMKQGLDFKPYLEYTLVGNINQDNLRIRSEVDVERRYWDDRYERDKTTGRSPEEVGRRNDLLWEAVERELPEVNHIIDVGCGDLRIWEDRDCEDYIGIDFSLKQLQRNKDVRRRHWTFLCADAAQFIPSLTRKNVFCFNTIYHILKPKKLPKVIVNLCRYATEKIFIYTWITNPFYPSTSDGEYQTYHPMGRYIELFRQNGFDLVSMEIPDPLNHDHLALYIYEKKEVPLELFPNFI